MAEHANDNLVQRSNARMETYKRIAIQDAIDAGKRQLTLADWQRSLDNVNKGKNQ